MKTGWRSTFIFHRASEGGWQRKVAMAVDGAVARSGGRGRVELGLPGLATERFKEKGAQATKRNWAKGENGL
jgi:hypothetical protein